MLGQKYNFSMPLENPLHQVGSTPVDPSTQTVPAYTPDDLTKFSPVVDDAPHRPGVVHQPGHPRHGIVGAYDTSTNPVVGGNENPYLASYASKPRSASTPLRHQRRHDPAPELHWASGTTHGPGGVDTPSEALKRAMELSATWTDLIRDNTAERAEGSGTVSY